MVALCAAVEMIYDSPTNGLNSLFYVKREAVRTSGLNPLVVNIVVTLMERPTDVLCTCF